MKLVTFDAGRVGRLEGEGDDAVVVELDCASTREWFERAGQAGETGERLPLAQVRLRAPIVPKKFKYDPSTDQEQPTRTRIPTRAMLKKQGERRQVDE